MSSASSADASPYVNDLSWGRIATQAGVFRDAKLWPGGGREWDWNQTGTDHAPGVQPADIRGLLDQKAGTILIGTGQQERLGVPEETERFVAGAGATIEVMATPQAVARYNRLAESGTRVAALLHSTC
jgi:hypothetical protein